MKSVWCFVFGVMCCLSMAAVADEIHLVNGDRISGTIDKLVDGKVHIKTELMGDVTVDAANVSSMVSDRELVVHLEGGEVIEGRASAKQVGAVAIGESVISLADISAINPPVKPPVVWSGNITVGATSTHGNTNSESLQVSASAQRRTETDRITASADLARSKQEDPDTGEESTTEQWWRTRGKYDLFFSEKMYGYLDGRYETDKIAKLDSRIIAGLRGGYQWIESDKTSFSTEGGVAWLTEQFEDQTETNREVSAQLGYNFNTKLHEKFRFINDLTYYPTFADPSDYFLTSTLEIRASITEKMYANFKTILDYDTTPAENSGRTDIKYILGVGWEF